MATGKRLIALDSGIRNPILRALWKCVEQPVEGVLGIRAVNDVNAAVEALLDDLDYDPDFFIKALRVLNSGFSVDVEALERIPKTGPLIVVANHPFGGLDGIVLGAAIQSARPDTRMLGNFLLNRINGIRGHLIAVDPFERKESKAANFAGVRAALRWLRANGCLATFPAGEVSHLNLWSRALVDRKWSPHTVSMAIKTGAQVLPVYFEGGNSWFFQIAGMMHPSMRTALLPRELARMRGRDLRLRVGQPIPADRLNAFETIDAASEYLRLVTYSLSNKPPLEKSRVLRFPFKSSKAGRLFKPLAPPESRAALRANIEALPPERLLVEHTTFRVFCAEAAEIPVVLREIGRLREETFRAVAEGTGQATDLDAFDPYYLHLFMWDDAAGEIVGSYRIGLIDRILKSHGRSGLYTSTLFNYKPGFIENLGSAMELGRSFICLNYQKKHASLALIWRGIGEFIVRNPEYNTLFGPVSITNAYQSISKNLMVHFLRGHSWDDSLADKVRAKKPPKAPRRERGISLETIAAGIKSADAVSAVVSGFETDRKGMPVLLRHYLKLNGTLLSLNVDPDFSDVIDGLILVDLEKTEPKLIQRYMGKEGYQSYVDYHRKKRLRQSAEMV